MPDETHPPLEAFVRKNCGDLPVIFAPPARECTDARIHFVLIGLEPDLGRRSDARQPFQIYRRYMVCASAPDSGRQAEMLESLMFGVLEGQGWELDATALSPDFWLALGLPPQPAFVLRVPVTRSRPLRQAPPVECVQLDLAPAGTLHGRVVDSAGLTVPNCLVEIPELRVRTIADVEGRFALPALSTVTSHKIRLLWKDKDVTLQPAPGSGFSEPLLLTID